MNQRNVLRELSVIALVASSVALLALVTDFPEILLRPFITTLPLRGAFIAGFVAFAVGIMVFGLRRWQQAADTQQQFRSLFETVPVGVFRSTPDGRFIMANPALAQMLGYDSPDQMIHAFNDITHQLYVNPERRTEYLASLTREGVVRDFENRVYRRDGSEIWILGNARLERDTNGNILYIEGNVEDITARKETEEAYKRLVDNSLQGIAILQSNHLVFANPAFGELLGMDATQIGALSLAQLIASIQDEDRDALLKRVRDRLQGKNVPAHQVFQVLRQDGKTRWVESTVSRIEYNNAPAAFILAVDVTERKHAQDAMQANVQRTRLREEVSAALARGGNDLQKVVNNLTRVLAANLGDNCVVALLSPDGAWIEISAFAHAEHERNAVLQQLFNKPREPVNTADLERVLKRGESLLVSHFEPEQIAGLKLPDYAAYMQTYAVSSFVVAPIRNGGQILGLLTLAREGKKEGYTANDQALLQELADRAALAIANAQLVERLQLELDARRQAEEKYRTLVEQIPAITYIASAEGVGETVYVSPQIEGTLGFTPEEWVSTPNFWTTRLHPDDSATVLEEDRRAKATGLPFRAEYRLIARDGTTHWIRDEAMLVYDAAHKPLYQHGIMMDVTASKSLELIYAQALKQSDAERSALRRELAGERELMEQGVSQQELFEPRALRAFFENSPDLLIAMDPDGTIRFVNPSAQAQYGYTPEELTGTHFDQVIHPDDLAAVREMMRRMKAQPERVHRIPLVRARAKNGEWRLTEGIGINRLDDPGFGSLLFNIHDVTEQEKQARTQIQEETIAREQSAFAKALADAAALLNSASEVGLILDNLLDTVARIVPYETASIMMQEGALLRTVRARGYEKYDLEKWQLTVTFGTDNPNFQQLVADPTPIVISETRGDPRWITLPETAWIRSHLTAPIRIGAVTVGLLGVDSPTPNFYTADHGARLLAFADLAGAAIHNADLLNETRQRAEEFRALYETMSELAAPVETAQMLDVVVERAMMLLNAPMGVLYASQPGETFLRRVVNHGMEDATSEILYMGEGLIGQVAASRQPRFVNDYQGWEFRVPEAAKQDIHACLAVPIAYGGTLSGVLGIAETRGDHKFDEKQLSLLTLFAGQVGAALERARLLSETRKRAEQLSLLYDLGLTLNRVLDSHTQLDFMFKIAQRALRSDNMMYFRFDSRTETLEYEMGVGVATQLATELQSVRLSASQPDSLVGWVANQRVPALVPNVKADLRWRRSDPMPDAAVGVPVEHEKELRGILLAVRFSPEPFTLQDERLLVLFANQIAAAMELTDLFEAQNQRQHELEILRQASLAFATTLERDALTKLILEYALRLVAADDALIFFYNDGKLVLGSLLWSKNAPTMPTNWEPRQDGFTYTVARTGKVQIIDEVNTHSQFSTWQWGGAIAGLPLMGGGRVRAVLNVAYQVPHRFTSEEIRVLELLGDQAAVALENVRNVQETQRQLRDAQILHRAGEMLNHTLSFQETLEQLAETFLEAFNVQMCSLSQLSPERDEIEILLDHDPIPETRAAPGTLFRLSENPYLEDLLREKKSRALRRDDPALSPRNAEIMDLYHWCSSLAVPLFSGAEVVGVVELADQRVARDFTREEIRLAESLAHQASSALQNARLFQETQQRAEQLNVLNHIARRVTGASTLDEMLAIIDTETATVLPSDASYIALYDATTEMVDFHLVVDYGETRPPFQWRLGPSLTRQVILSGRALRMDDRSEYPSVDNPPQYYGDGSMLRAWLGVPIRSGKRVLGVISLQSKRRASYSAADEQLLQTIADQVAAAVERALRSG